MQSSSSTRRPKGLERKLGPVPFPSARRRATLDRMPKDAANDWTAEEEIRALERVVDELRVAPLEARQRMMRYLWDRFVDHPCEVDSRGLDA